VKGVVVQGKEVKVIKLDSARIRTMGIGEVVDQGLIELGARSSSTISREGLLNETKMAAVTTVLEIDPLPAFLGENDFFVLMKYCADYGFRLRIGDNGMQQLAISYMTGKLHVLHGMDWSPARDLANKMAVKILDPMPEAL
jgi:hypothetical protein